MEVVSDGVALLEEAMEGEWRLGSGMPMLRVVSIGAIRMKDLLMMMGMMAKMKQRCETPLTEAGLILRIKLRRCIEDME